MYSSLHNIKYFTRKRNIFDRLIFNLTNQKLKLTDLFAMGSQRPDSNPNKVQLFDNRYVEGCSRTAKETNDAMEESDHVREFLTGILIDVM